MLSDGDKPLELPRTLEDAERFQRLFVVPMVDTVKTEMTTHFNNLRAEFATDRGEQSKLREDVDKLKGNQKKALAGWGAFATVLSISTAAAWNWIVHKFKITQA